MIFYFSGTGNSRLTAKQLAGMTEDELVSINQHLKAGKKQIFHSNKPLVFVVPTYAWRIPRVVDQWIRENRFEGSKNVYFVLTCGGGVGGASAYAQKLCADTGLHFQGLAQLLMPENYMALYATPDVAESRVIVEKAMPHIEEFADLINKGKQFPEIAPSLRERLQSGPVNSAFYRFVVHDKGFRVSDACISCGKCAKRCPLNNIGIAGGKPVWHGTCTHCMACIGGCPVRAIEYKNSKDRNQYYIREDL